MQEMQDEKYIEFRVRVLDAASKQAEQIVQQAKDYRQEQIDATKKMYNQDSYNKRKKQLEAERSHHISQTQQKNRKELLQYRELLVSGMFAEIKQKLVAFASSGDYKNYLKTRLEKCIQLVPDGKQIVIYVCEKDLQHQTMLQDIFKNSTVEKDADIAIGGIKVAFDKKVIIETLDNALENEQKSFLTYCGLLV